MTPEAYGRFKEGYYAERKWQIRFLLWTRLNIVRENGMA